MLYGIDHAHTNSDRNQPDNLKKCRVVLVFDAFTEKHSYKAAYNNRSSID
jgi:hypothetical protein